MRLPSDKAEAFLTSDLGRRMVNADVALATLGEANIDKVMDGEITTPSTPKRDAIVEKLERATHSTESTVQIFLGMGQARRRRHRGRLRHGPHRRRGARAQVGRGEPRRTGREHADSHPPFHHLWIFGISATPICAAFLAFMESRPGQRYVAAYNASMDAGFDAMGRRTGEQLGESLRELAQAQLPPSVSARGRCPARQHRRAAPLSGCRVVRTPSTFPR